MGAHNLDVSNITNDGDSKGEEYLNKVDEEMNNQPKDEDQK